MTGIYKIDHANDAGRAARRCPLDKRCDREFGMEGKVNGGDESV